jgi:DNA uptake protein ComE-like DNA-binding protein
VIRKHLVFVVSLVSFALLILLTACGSAVEESTSNGNSTGSDQIDQTSGAVTTSKLNLNEAADDDFLNTIPGMGNRMVREFAEYRPYVSIQQFRREIGKYVDDAQVADYELYVYVPVDVDEADAETLMQLPGVDETIVNTLMDRRPYGSNEAFLAALAEHISPDELAVAETYLASN